MKAILFAGQGAQRKGMGGDLFDRYPEVTESASNILGYSIKTLCTQDPNTVLGQTAYTQPAMYVVNHLEYLHNVVQRSVKVDFVAGHSLGEFNALLAAQVFDFETGLKLVHKRGQLMSQSSEGGMAAIIGVPHERIEGLLREHHLDSIDIANYNTPSQTVVSGELVALKAFSHIIAKLGARYVPLRTSAAFHSRYMNSARQEFATYLKQIQFNAPQIPVVANVTAKPYHQQEVSSLLADQVSSSVHWVQSIEAMLASGVTDFEEFGTNLFKRMVEEIKAQYTPTVPTIKDGVINRIEPIDDVASHQVSVDDQGSVAAPLKQAKRRISASQLGSEHFRRDYGISYAYVAGAMYRGIASEMLVANMLNAGFLAFFGAGGFTCKELEEKIIAIKQLLTHPDKIALNLLCNLDSPEKEIETVKLYLEHGVQRVEAAAYLQITEALVLYRLTGLARDVRSGGVTCRHKVLAKVSRPEVAEAFMRPAPSELVEKLLLKGLISQAQADMSREVPMAYDICVEADSGGHTDAGNPTVLFPAIRMLMRRTEKEYGYDTAIRIGLAGGIGSPESATSAFVMGADFILTGSINQCTVEAQTSDAAKDLLQLMNIQDTAYAPAADMFEIGAKVQVLKRGVFFPARANKLFSLYQQYDSLDAIPADIATQVQERYFGRSFADIWAERCLYLERQGRHAAVVEAERRPKLKMASVFKWYFFNGSKSALEGTQKSPVNFQIQTGPALGSFNQWVKGTELESWRNRHVVGIANKMMSETATLMTHTFDRLCS